MCEPAAGLGVGLRVAEGKEVGLARLDDGEQLGQLHSVLGEPPSEAELQLAFRAMDPSDRCVRRLAHFLAW